MDVLHHDIKTRYAYEFLTCFVFSSRINNKFEKSWCILKEFHDVKEIGQVRFCKVNNTEIFVCCLQLSNKNKSQKFLSSEKLQYILSAEHFMKTITDSRFDVTSVKFNSK